jgi:hypothetical protein
MTIDMTDKKACQLIPNPDFLGESDFLSDDGKYREIKIAIATVTQEELQLPGRSAKASKIVIGFKTGKGAAKKRLVCNKTNVRAIKSHYGREVCDWVGKAVTLYFDPSVKFGRETVGGVRIRPKQ